MYISVDRQTNEVKGLNLAPTPLYVKVEVQEGFHLEKSITVINQGQPLVQKQDEQGKLLYKDNIVNEFTFDEVHFEDGLKPTKFEDKEVTNTFTDEEGVEHSETVTIQVPVEFEQLEPVMIDNYITQTVTLADCPTEFTIEEVLNEKYRQVLENSQKDFILADTFLNEQDIDLAYEKHTANTGLMLLQLLPHGEAQTVAIELQQKANIFEMLELDVQEGVEIYINETKFIDGKATLPTQIDSCTLKFVNITDKPKLVTSYAIGY